MRLLALGALVVLATCGACEDGSEATPTASPTTTEAVDGTVYALIQASDGKTVTWDQLEYRHEACKAVQSEGNTYEQQFEACYSNPDGMLRTAPLDAATKVIVRPGNDPTRTVSAAALPTEITADAANGTPPQYRVWRIAMSGGRVVAIEQAT